jgi:hypothetical protein
VTQAGEEELVDGSFTWAGTSNPTTPSELTESFNGTDFVEFDFAEANFTTLDGPSPFGTANGSDWRVDKLQVKVQFGSGSSNALVPADEGVQLRLTGPDTLNLSNSEPGVVNTEGEAPLLFAQLGSGDGEEAGRIEGLFAGGSGEGLLTSFLVEDVDSSGELIEGVKILTQSEFAGVLGNSSVAMGAAGTNANDTLDSQSEFILQGDGIAEVASKDGEALTRVARSTGFIDVNQDASLVETGTLAGLDAVWGRWSGDVQVANTDRGTRNISDGGAVWGYTGNPTTEAELGTVFDAGTTATYAGASGPSPVGARCGADWNVDELSVTMQFTAGDTSAEIAANDVSLGLTNGSTSYTLENLEGQVVQAADLGFDIFLEQTSGSSADAEVEATFAGDEAEGLLVEFDAREFDDQTVSEAVEGVKFLEQQ